MDPEMQARFQQWKEAQMENRQGDMSNVFGLAEALARQGNARQANSGYDTITGDVLAQMLNGMGGAPVNPGAALDAARQRMAAPPPVASPIDLRSLFK